MEKKVALKKLIDTTYFELPPSKLKSSLVTLKFRTVVVKVEREEAEIFVSNKTSMYDKFFITNSFETPFVFLKDEVILKMYNGEISKEEKKQLTAKINELFESNISVVIFPEKHLSIFGDYEKIPPEITNFIKSLGKTVNFINLIGTYFIRPIWAENENRCQTKLEQKFTITKNLLDILDDAGFNEKLNEFMPSSASTYAKKYKLFIQGKKLAENLETIIYACPNCKKLFTLYSEFNCVKCEDCQTAFEYSTGGELNLSKEFRDLDEAKAFQRRLLSNYQLDGKCIIGYKNIILWHDKKTSEPVEFRVFKNHIAFSGQAEEKISYKDILDISLSHQNILSITKKDKTKFVFQGKNKENFVIIFDLIQLK